MSRTLLARVVESRKAVRAEHTAVRDEVDALARRTNLSASEQRQFDRLVGKARDLRQQIDDLDERSEELLGDIARSDAAASARLTPSLPQTGTPVTQTRSGWSVGAEPTTYGRPGGPSYFRDLYDAGTMGNPDAQDRLQRAQQENRALGNTGGTGGAGGDFSFPAFMGSEYVALARAGRVTADRCMRAPLPDGASSVVVPKVLSGTAVAPQSTQNTSLASVDATTGALTSQVITVGGKQVVSEQLLRQASGVDFDRVILSDLAAETARQVDRQVLFGTGASGQALGLLTMTGTQQVTYTAATPTATGFYTAVNQAISLISATRFLPPDAIIMAPRRWSWLVAQSDSTGRPLVVPVDGYNTIGQAGDVAAEGAVGRLAGLPVFLDANLPLNLGTATNQDPMIIARFSDLMLWESPVELEAFRETYSDSLAVLLRAVEYLSFQPSRYPQAVAVVNGTGMAAPSGF